MKPAEIWARYNSGVALRLLLLVLIGILSSCSKAPQSKDAIRQAVLDHLGKRADMLAASMNIEVVSVSFRDKEADAVVSVSPKEGGSGIQMTYSLAAEGNKWVVKKSGAPTSANPHDGMPAGPSSGGLPAGHPPVGGGGGSVHSPNPKAPQ